MHNAVWSPTLISSVRVGWNGIAWDNVLPDQALNGIGIPGVDESNPGFSQIAITGYPTLGVTQRARTPTTRGTGRSPAT